ncbi:hypothetical protein [Rhodopseudomonas palustris]|uniref:Uncharacterized protein n=1 Tax=Rhodopseudomonas palustris TaxID=1076 RepID=A0A418VR33_RHOPL|nr:hypothetical protein [Rhodopseudomonas palustris]RJF78812.1 hypothetical protein D4Q52_01270 [Rhodopseudomonas palustris]
MPRNGSRGSNSGDGGPVEAAGYVAEVVGDLIRIADVHHLEVLCYLLDMARMEATEIGRRLRVRNE